MENPTLSTIKGYGAIVAELKPILTILKDPSAFAALGVNPPKGLLFTGEPGTGKTTMAKAFIAESGRPCFAPTQTSTTEQLLSEVHDAFLSAGEAAPSIVFLDDMDKYITNGDVDSHALHVVQALIDSVAELDVYVVATANGLDDMPESLLRKGRFDRILAMEMNGAEEARELLDLFLSEKKADGIDVDDVAAMCRFMTVASIKSFVNEAAINAAYEGCEAIRMRHVVAAGAHRKVGREFAAVDPHDEICIHEIGHVLLAEACQDGSVGFVVAKPEAGSGYTRLRRDLKRRPHEVLMSLAGKAAVEQVLGRLASGCYSDLRDAYETVLNGVADTGTLGLSHLGQKKDMAQPYVTSELDRFMLKAREVVSANLAFVHAASELLGKQGYLLLSDIAALKQAHPIDSSMLQGI